MSSIAPTPPTTPPMMYLSVLLDDVRVVVGPPDDDDPGLPVAWESYLNHWRRIRAIRKGQQAKDVRVLHIIEQDRGIIDTSRNVDAKDVGAVGYRRIRIDQLIVRVQVGSF
jgi:hypothetical protein